MSKFIPFLEHVPELTQSVMIAETISLGILALPKALATLGLVPYDTYSVVRV